MLNRHRSVRPAGPLVAALLLLALAAGPAASAPAGPEAVVTVGGWTGPTRIGSVDGCSGVAIAHAAPGARHVVATCGSNVRYLTDASGGWVTTTFSHPADRIDLEPRVALDGDVVHVAYTRFMPEEGARESVGVYHRQKPVGDDTWSTAVRLGSSGDILDAFTVADGVVHAVVEDGAGAISYETDVSGTLRRYRLPGATGAAALHVQDDRAARFVYETTGALRYAVFHGFGFDWSSIPGTDATAEDPQLVLDAGNKAHVTWTHPRPPDVGTTSSADGVFYATNRTGVWTATASRRITANIGPSALDLDLETRQPHVIVATDAGVKHYTPASDLDWGGLTLTAALAGDVGVTFDQQSGRVVAVYSGDGLYLLTKP